MKKLSKKLTIELNKQLGKVYLFETFDEAFSKARILEEEISSPIILSSFLCALKKLIKKANLSSAFNYTTNVVLPNCFFEREIIKIKNTFLNNFFVKNKLLSHYNNFEKFLLNYKKLQTSSLFIMFEVCLIKKNIVNELKNINKQFNLNIKYIIDEKLSKTNFLVNNIKNISDEYILIDCKEQKFNIDLIKLNENKWSGFVERENKGNSNTFADLCKSLMISPKFVQEKAESFKNEAIQDNETLNLYNKIKGFDKNNNIEVFLIGHDASLVLSALKIIDNNLNINLINKMVGTYASNSNFTILGANYKLKNNEINAFSVNLTSKLIFTFKNCINNIKIYLSYLKNKKNKNKSISVKIVEQ